VHILRPLVIITSEFGKRWGSLPYDYKQSISCVNNGITTLDQLQQIISTQSTYHHVESIPTTLEAIYASMITTTGSVILLHMKLQPMRRSCDILIKSNNKDVCQQQCNELAAIISSHRP